MNVLLRRVSSSIGCKVLVAITGLLLVGFVLTHMAGNLLIFVGRDWFNDYAHHLKSLGPFLWMARIGLLAVFLLHLGMALRLSMTNHAARPTAYAYEDTMQASWASRHMVLTGVVVLAFVVFHLAHFTLGYVHKASAQYDTNGAKVETFDPPKNYLDLADKHESLQWEAAPKTNLSTHHGDPGYRHDLYSTVINGFRNSILSSLYLLAMAALGLHLWHGASSMLQTLGLNGRSAGGFVAGIGPAIALLVVAGNSAIVLSVWLGIIGK